MSIVLRDLCKNFAGLPVVNHVNVEIQDGEMFVLLGGSGSGKSTILRLIAGLTSPDGGSIHLHGKDVTRLPPQARGTGFVFQNYSIFKHMTVAENIQFGLRVRKVPRPDRCRRSDELMELVEMAGLGERYPSQLSGGQLQRVALARALAYEPAVLLLDEPFGALDVKIRGQLRRSLLDVQRQLKVTAILVTHDQEEGFELADRIGVLEKGRMLEVGTPQELYHRPSSQFVATFVGGGNVLVGEMRDQQIELGTRRIPLAGDGATPVHLERARVRLLARPENVEVEASERLRDAEDRAEKAEERAATAEKRITQTESDLSAARERLERAEAERAGMERKAYESARQNTDLQVRLRELAQRLDDGEQRLAELGDLSAALAEARARVADLASEGGRIRSDLESVRRQASEKVERLRLRIVSLKDRLRIARRSGQDPRDISALRTAVPWPSPATATYAAAPTAPQAAVPWPSPVTATYTPYPSAQPPAWPVPPTAAYPPPNSPSGAFPVGPDVATARRSDSSNQAVGEHSTQVWSAPSAGRRPNRTWAIVAGSIAAVAVALAWLSSTVPIASRAVINARTISVVTTIPGVTKDLRDMIGTRVSPGSEIAKVRNDELDRSRLRALQERALTIQSRQVAADESLRRAEAEFNRLARELAEQPATVTVAESEPKRRLRDEYATRVVEIKGLQDDLRIRRSELDDDAKAEERRLEQNRIATIASQVDGVVWKVNPSHNVSAGMEIATIAESDTVVIEAELDDAWSGKVKKGDKALIRFGTSEFLATVRDAPAGNELNALAIQPVPSEGCMRVFLEVEPDMRATLCQNLNKSARVAFADPATGWTTRLALALRF